MKRLVLLIGLVLLGLGCATLLYLGFLIGDTRLIVLLDSIIRDTWTSRFERMRCPMLLTLHETGTVSVTLANDRPWPVTYGVRIEEDRRRIHALRPFVSARAFASPRLFLTPPSSSSATVPPGETVVLTWPVTAVGTGPAAVIVSAYVRPRAPIAFFDVMVTSLQRCGIRVIDSSLRVSEIVGLSLGSILLGALLCIAWLVARARQHRR
jgi:hypothetical protein